MNGCTLPAIATSEIGPTSYAAAVRNVAVRYRQITMPLRTWKESTERFGNSRITRRKFGTHQGKMNERHSRAAIDQKHAEYEDLQQCAENSARNLIREINDMRDVLHRMLEAPTTQVSASWKRELQQALVRK